MSLVLRFYKSLFISSRWYQLGVGIIVLFVLSYGIPALFTVAQLLLLFLGVVTLLDYIVLFATRQPVAVERVVADSSPLPQRYEPGHPDADSAGYVTYPNVNPVMEMADLLSAVRAYQLNAAAVQAAKSMIQQSLQILT